MYFNKMLHLSDKNKTENPIVPQAIFSTLSTFKSSNTQECKNKNSFYFAKKCFLLTVMKFSRIVQKNLCNSEHRFSSVNWRSGLCNKSKMTGNAFSPLFVNYAYVYIFVTYFQIIL